MSGEESRSALVSPRRAIALGLLLACISGGCRREAVTSSPPTPDPHNQLPFGNVEAPRNNDTVGRIVDVAGWALDDSAVRFVRVYVDGTYQVTAQITVPRPDIETVYPKYVTPDSKHGWSTAVDLGDRAGLHEVLVQAVDDHGASRNIGTVTVNLIGR
jgi:Big-like domain-containing protein